MDRSERAFRLRVGEVGIGILVRERSRELPSTSQQEWEWDLGDAVNPVTESHIWDLKPLLKKMDNIAYLFLFSYKIT